MENNKINEYIKQVCELIKNKDAHYDISLELKDHIETLKEEFLEEGLSLEEATEKAISHMGSPTIVGKELNKTHKAKFGWGFIIPLLCFSIFGLVAIYFIQSTGALAEAGQMKMFQKNLIFYIIGIAMMIGLYFYDYRRILPYSKIIYVVAVLILMLQWLFNVPVNGSFYFHLGPITINLVPYSLILIVISLAGILHNWQWNNPYEFIKALGIMLFPTLLMFTPSISYVFLFFIVCTTLMIMAKAKIYQILTYFLAPIFSFFLYVLLAPYRMKRLFVFLNPESDPTNSGWMYLQIKKVIEGSGAFGNGFTMNPKTLPELHTDFILTYIVYTFGWVTAVIIITMIIIFLLKLVNVAKTTKNSYGKLLVSSFIAMLGAEFLINIGMNLGLTPIIGISLPFISFGGTQMIINMIIIGLILSIYRRKDICHNFTKNHVLEK